MSAYLMIMRSGGVVLPEPIEPLKGKAATEFIEYDKRPLTQSEKKSLQEAVEFYSKHKPKR